MPPPRASEDFYRTVQRYELLLVAAGRAAWRRMRPADFDGSWATVGPQLTAYTAGAQLAAATAATEYVPRVLAETGQPDRPEAAVRPAAFSGRASDGRTLSGLLEGSVVASKRAAERGLDGAAALLVGQRWLDQALQTAVADAARDATTAEIVARPGMGWVRMVNPPCCSRCAVLAGAWYRWNRGFQRHPNCDCVHIPASENVAGSFTTSPKRLVEQGLVTDLTPAQRKRIDDGADLNRVLNESRDRWRERMAADRRAARKGWGSPETAPLTATVHDFMAHLTSRVDALKAMRSAGIAD